ncbi:MAG TPA: hypothetical protein VJB59_03825 [Bdellovibrionota bacterium]|nr:hypothetical protein [Bdellovibrionota bacterium]
MKTFLSFLLLAITQSAIAADMPPEKVLRFSGIISIQEKTKYPVCITVFEHFVSTRGVTAFSGYMEVAKTFFNGIPLDVPAFTVAGNITSDQSILLTAFDRNNISSDDPELFLAQTDIKVLGKDWKTLKLTQNGHEAVMTLKEIGTQDPCALQEIKTP